MSERCDIETQALLKQRHQARMTFQPVKNQALSHAPQAHQQNLLAPNIPRVIPAKASTSGETFSNRLSIQVPQSHRAQTSGTTMKTTRRSQLNSQIQPSFE